MTDEQELQIAIHRAEKPNFLTETRFDDFELPKKVLEGLNDLSFINCTPIQAQVLPLSLTGRDVAGQAQTGTGKTAAFLVTVFTRLLALPHREARFPSALIVAPTRELALQIHRDAVSLSKRSGLSLALAVGGIDYQKQAEILRQGADIVICTPGRIIDYFKQGIFKTKGVKALVIDEADRLFDLGFSKDMRYILRKLPHYEKRQSMLFSATLSYRVIELTYEYMNLPEIIAVTPEEIAVDGIEQSLFHVGKEEKLSLLLGLLKREDADKVLIFVNTKAGVEWLAEKLKGNGWPAEGITGDLPQHKRLRLMERFRNERIMILVATDVASRGIHVEDISHVINYDLPQDVENYIHRIGRTARAGKTGRALTLACEKYVFHLDPLEKMIGHSIPVVWPEDEWFEEDKSGPVYSRKKGYKGKPERGNGRKKKMPAHGKTPKKTTARSRPKEGSASAPKSGSATGSGSPATHEKKHRWKKSPRTRRPRTQSSQIGSNKESSKE